MTITAEKWFEYTPKKPAKTSALSKAVVISVFNQKGGVGKTTSTISLAAALAEYGRKVLVVDFDPQGSLTVGLTGNQEIEPNIYHVVMGANKISDILVKTSAKSVDLVPSGIDLSVAEGQLITAIGREYIMAKALEPVIDQYDYILIDCLPSLGLLAVQALTASDFVLIPMQCEFFALKGIQLLEGTVELVINRTNPRLKVLGLLPTMFKPVGHHKEVLQRVLAWYEKAVFHVAIPETIKFSDATHLGVPITISASNSPAAEAYRKAAAEVIERVEVNK